MIQFDRQKQVFEIVLCFSVSEGGLNGLVAAEAVAFALQQPNLLESGKTDQSNPCRGCVGVGVGVVRSSDLSTRKPGLADPEANPRGPELHPDGHGLEGEESDLVRGQGHSKGW